MANRRFDPGAGELLHHPDIPEMTGKERNWGFCFGFFFSPHVF